MSAKFRILKKLYDAGKVTKDGLRQAVQDGVITADEYEQITGEPYQD